jgi:5-methylcytosine-specific restriction endonuclease McrA
MPRGIRDEKRRLRAIAMVERQLHRVTRKKKWTARQVAEIVYATLTPARVTYGVIGPCFYCGDELATTVDHIVPLADGGLDGHPNVVSCCVECNTLKHITNADSFLVYYPFGKDRERNIAVHDRLAALWKRRREAA